MTTRNLPVRSEAVNTAANYPATPLAPYFYYSSYGLGDQIQRRHFEVSKETPFAISVYIRQTSSLGQAATESHCRFRLTQWGHGGVNRVAGLIQQSRTHFLWKGTPYPNFDWKVWLLLICLEKLWKLAHLVANQFNHLKKKLLKSVENYRCYFE